MSIGNISNIPPSTGLFVHLSAFLPFRIIEVAKLFVLLSGRWMNLYATRFYFNQNLANLESTAHSAAYKNLTKVRIVEFHNFIKKKSAELSNIRFSIWELCLARSSETTIESPTARALVLASRFIQIIWDGEWIHFMVSITWCGRHDYNLKGLRKNWIWNIVHLQGVNFELDYSCTSEKNSFFFDQTKRTVKYCKFDRFFMILVSLHYITLGDECNFKR